MNLVLFIFLVKTFVNLVNLQTILLKFVLCRCGYMATVIRRAFLFSLNLADHSFFVTLCELVEPGSQMLYLEKSFINE